jgi:hypothetical protein
MPVTNEGWLLILPYLLLVPLLLGGDRLQRYTLLRRTADSSQTAWDDGTGSSSTSRGERNAP